MRIWPDVRDVLAVRRRCEAVSEQVFDRFAGTQIRFDVLAQRWIPVTLGRDRRLRRPPDTQDARAGLRRTDSLRHNGKRLLSRAVAIQTCDRGHPALTRRPRLVIRDLTPGWQKLHRLLRFSISCHLRSLSA